MRKILLIIVLLNLSFTHSQDTKYLSINYELKKGETAYSFGDDVKLREAPNSDSKVISFLKINEEIKVIERTPDQLLYDGIEWYWYKVEYNEQIGYVLGGLISLDKVTLGNTSYLVSLKKEGLKQYAKVRLVEKDKEYIEQVSPLSTPEFSLKVFDNKGIENIKNILLLDYLAESCGVNGGGIYLFYDGNKLSHAIDYIQVADADAYWYVEDYIFPDDKEGIKGKILYKREVGETKDYHTGWIETKLTQRLLEWKDNQIIPNIVKDEKD